MVSPSSPPSSYRNSIRNWFHKKIADPFVQILRRGAEPKELAFSAALGITLGVFPICANAWAVGSIIKKVLITSSLASTVVTLFLCGIAIALLGDLCHAPSVMLANFVATPIELSLVVPFLRFGEIITGGSHFPLTSDALKKVFTGKASHDVLLSIAHALLGWAVAAPFILATLYVVFLPASKLLVRKFSSVPSSPRKALLPPSEVGLKNFEVI